MNAAVKTIVRVARYSVLLAGFAAVQGCGGGSGNSGGSPPVMTQPSSAPSLALTASATLTPTQAAQPETIFLYSFPLPAGQQNFVGLSGSISMNSPSAIFNEALITVATNISGTCPTNGSVFPDYTTISNAFPNLLPIQGFILKSPASGTVQLPINYTMPIGLQISNCVVVMLDWEGQSPVTMSSNLTMSYTPASSSTTGELLSTGQEFVFGGTPGPGVTANDALSFAQETTVPQSGTILGFVGDISDSSYFVAPPPGPWQTTNDIYLVPGGCPSSIPVDSTGETENAGDYYADIPANAQHLLSVPLSGTGAQEADEAVFQSSDVLAQTGDCLITLFGLNSPGGGGIDAETQVQTMFLPSGGTGTTMLRRGSALRHRQLRRAAFG